MKNTQDLGKTGLDFKRFLTLGIGLLMSSHIHSADLQPPDWRGQPGSSHQAWSFDFTDKGGEAASFCGDFNGNPTPWGQRNTPDKLDNPFQKQTGICTEYQTPWMISGRMDWLRQHNSKDGVWMLKRDRNLPVFLNFMIPNADIDTGGRTQVSVQVIYQQHNLEPDVLLRYPSAETGESFISLPPVQKNLIFALPQDWKLQLFLFELAACPLYQIVQINPPESRQPIYIDEVIIDTICHKP